MITSLKPTFFLGLLLLIVLPVIGQDSTQKTTANLHTDSSKAEKVINKAAQSLETVADATYLTFGNIISSLLVIALCWFLVRLTKRLLILSAERSTKHRIIIKGFIPVVSMVLWILTSYIILVTIFSPPQETLLAGMASIGIAVGFAAQDIIKNIFAGLVIILDTPFRVGDKIEVGNHYGEVIQMGLRSTKITTADDSMVTIPNSEVMNNAVSNSNTGEANCQVVAEIYLPPFIDTIHVRNIAQEAAMVCKHIYLNKPIAVLFFNEVSHGVPYLKMRLKAYVMDIRSEFAFKSEMTELVMQQLYKEGILDRNYDRRDSSDVKN